MNWPLISDLIAGATGQAFNLVSAYPLMGGDINTAYRLQGVDKAYFIKLNHAGLIDMFAAEFAGLEELAATQTLKVPLPIVSGIAGQHSFLVLEYIKLGSAAKDTSQLLSAGLAALHRQTQPYFGWHRDNTIGSTCQFNQANSNWCDFWRGQRLAKQLKLAAQNGYTGKLQTLGECLLANLELFFGNYQPLPSLVHGDLWGGNWGVDQIGRPVIFDPACYYGDRETDLAMTELFGGFSQDFYAAYQASWRLDDGYALRKTLYNLYHILNHLNLFGGAYLSQAENVTAKLLAEIR